jgi:HD superfamily phosphohydrolase YqeK
LPPLSRGSQRADEEDVTETRATWRIWGGALFGLSTLTALVLARVDGVPPLSMILLFGSLMLFSELKAVFINGVSVSPGWMIGMASVVAFRGHGSLLGPVIIGMIAGIDLLRLRHREWSTLMGTDGMLGLAYLAAAGGYSLLPASLSVHLPAALVAPVVPTLFYVVAVCSIFAAGTAIRYGTSLREIVAELIPATAEALSFSLVGFLLGRMYVQLGAMVMLLIIAPILVAREMFSSYMRVKESHDETVQLLIRALEQKDPYTAGHAGRVAVYAEYVGEELEFMPARMERLRFAALMHDIGKLVVPNQLLNKPGKLTEEEFARVRIHEGVSVQMLSHIDFLRPIAMHTHSEQMRFDPDDLDHPIEPYIIMVADAYDAMTSTRSYRKALPQEIAFEELRNKSGTQFHPACAEALIRAIEKRNEVHGKGFEEKTHFEDAPEVGLGSAGLGDLLADEKAKK